MLTEAIEMFLEYNNCDIQDSKKLINEYIKKSKEADYKEYLHQNIEDIKNHSIPPIAEGFEIMNSFCFSYDYQTEKTADLISAKISASNTYESACCIFIGEFNDCPNSETQTAVCEYWYEKYNAYPAAAGYDTLEISAEKQTQTEKEVIELAAGHYNFCLDRKINMKDQYSENYDHRKLSGTLLKSDVWYFLRD